MSGPKIVDIRVLQAIQERQRRLQEQRLNQLKNQWRNHRNRLDEKLRCGNVIRESSYSHWPIAR